MADNLDPKEIAITLLLVSILFHYFSYSFTIQAIDYSNYDISLDIGDLYASGIMLGNYDEHNITYNAGTWTEFTINETTIRTRWQTWTIFYVIIQDDGFLFNIQENFFSFESWQQFKIQDMEDTTIIRNQTIIQNWEPEHNYSRFHGVMGYALFFTDPLQQGNITRAIQEDGIVTLTIAEDIAWSEEPNPQKFIQWYIGLVTGNDDWGLPENFSIIVRIISLIGVFAGIFLLSELRRIVI